MFRRKHADERSLCLLSVCLRTTNTGAHLANDDDNEILCCQVDAKAVAIGVNVTENIMEQHQKRESGAVTGPLVLVVGVFIVNLLGREMQNTTIFRAKIRLPL